MSRGDLEFELPPELVAQEPIAPRDAARLLLLERATGALSELRFSDLASQARPEDLFVVNDTRVVPAKLRGTKSSGGKAEALLLQRRPDGDWTALVKVRGRVVAGLELVFGELGARVVEVLPGGACRLALAAPEGVEPDALLDRIGEAPLPPYIRRDSARARDLADYQTVFAREPGAVAAPTASLHFTEALAARLRLARVTLHVGPGTFRPMRCERPEDHVLEPERFAVPEATAQAIADARAAGGRVVAVGTTVVRALETTGGAAGAGETKLLVLPGHEFRAVDSLVTNFHLPGSSLLALVMAFAGVEATKRAYAHAIAARFRFYSYGDALWIR
ncbi:MAG TPA: tRNA preQ1(34) S-adenosylmethionine ribosyltransferase-isomerase QueA [Myxococcota bacterium]|nr:tRNA preQ1(34) S-adenosylmethionine ribosyltransferase-isomerase QueA [Myxococcota bacterium]